LGPGTAAALSLSLPSFFSPPALPAAVSSVSSPPPPTLTMKQRDPPLLKNPYTAWAR
jgi:hypothetical protein